MEISEDIHKLDIYDCGTTHYMCASLPTTPQVGCSHTGTENVASKKGDILPPVLWV